MGHFYNIDRNECNFTRKRDILMDMSFKNGFLIIYPVDQGKMMKRVGKDEWTEGKEKNVRFFFPRFAMNLHYGKQTKRGLFFLNYGYNNWMSQM